MDYEQIEYALDGHVATITLNRPERMNAFSPLMIAEWADAIRRTSEDGDARVLVVTGAGRAFSAGMDLKERAEANARSDAPTPIDRRNDLRLRVHRIAQALQYLDKPYIAAVNGAAIGAAMDMTSMADVRFAADTARFAMGYVNIGLIPGNGGAWLLPRIVGVTRALELLWSGELFDAQRALDIGYVSRVVPADSLMDETYAYARKLAEGPPIAMQMAKRLVYRGLNQSFLEALEASQAAMTIAQSTEDAREGPRAFAAKRKPEFHGR